MKSISVPIQRFTLSVMKVSDTTSRVIVKELNNTSTKVFQGSHYRAKYCYNKILLRLIASDLWKLTGTSCREPYLYAIFEAKANILQLLKAYNHG